MSATSSADIDVEEWIELCEELYKLQCKEYKRAAGQGRRGRVSRLGRCLA